MGSDVDESPGYEVVNRDLSLPGKFAPGLDSRLLPAYRDNPRH